MDRETFYMGLHLYLPSVDEESLHVVLDNLHNDGTGPRVHGISSDVNILHREMCAFGLSSRVSRLSEQEREQLRDEIGHREWFQLITRPT